MNSKRNKGSGLDKKIQKAEKKAEHAFQHVGMIYKVWAGSEMTAADERRDKAIKKSFQANEKLSQLELKKVEKSIHQVTKEIEELEKRHKKVEESLKNNGGNKRRSVLFVGIEYAASKELQEKIEAKAQEKEELIKERDHLAESLGEPKKTESKKNKVKATFNQLK